MTSPLRLLLIDGNLDVAQEVLDALRPEYPDARVEQTADQDALAAALTAGALDIILAERYLPWADGLAVLRTVRVSRPEAPFLFFTADRDAVPDADILGQCVLEALEELKDSASDTRPRAPRGRSRSGRKART